MKKAWMVVKTKRTRVAMIPTWAGTKFFFLSFLRSLAVRAGMKLSQSVLNIRESLIY